MVPPSLPISLLPPSPIWSAVQLHSPNEQGLVALIEACRQGKAAKDCVEILVTTDPVIEGSFDAAGKTALHVAAVLDNSAGHELVVSLLKNGVSSKILDRGGLTAMCNDFDINLTHLSSLASPSALATVPRRAVCITLLDTWC